MATQIAVSETLRIELPSLIGEADCCTEPLAAGPVEGSRIGCEVPALRADHLPGARTIGHIRRVAKDDEARYCTNCRAEMPPGESACPDCGVYAGEVFDGRVRPQRGGGKRWLVALVALVVVVAAAWFALGPARPTWQKQQLHFDRGPARVVKGRPGAKALPRGASVGEGEAIRLLRRRLTAADRTDPVRSDCLAVMSGGLHAGSWTLSAYDSCAHRQLGRWRVDAKSGEVTAQ